MQTSQKSLLLFVLLAACSDDDPATVRVVNASPGAPPLDVYVDDATVPFATVAYGQTSPYVDIDNGDHQFSVFLSGTSTLVYTSSTVVLHHDDTFTVIAAGDFASTDPSTSFRLLSLQEDFGDTNHDQARMRIVNALPQLAAIDVDLDDNGTIEFTSLNRFQDTGHKGIETDIGVTRQIAIRGDGVRLSGFTTPPLPSRGEEFVIVTGFLDQLPREPLALQLFAVGDNGVLSDVLQNPRVYMLHASPDTPATDVRIDGTLTYPDLAFSELMAAQIPPGDFTFTFSPVGDPNVIVASSRVVGLAAGQSYLAIASGMLTPVAVEDARFNVAVYLDQFIDDAQPRIRAINSSPDSPIIDMSTAAGGRLDQPPLFSELDFTEASDGVGLVVPAIPSLILGVATTKTTTPFARFDMPTSAAPREFLVLAGAVSPLPDEQFYRMLRIDARGTPWTIQTTSVIAP